MNATIAELRETHRMHQALLRACTRLVLQIKAIERRVSGAAMRDMPTIERLPASSHQAPEADDRPLSEVDMPPEPGIDSHARESVGAVISKENLSRGREPDHHPRAADGVLTSFHTVPHGDDPDNHCRVTEEDATPTGALSRGGDPYGIANLATLPLQEALAGIRRHELKLRRRLEKLGKALPVYPFVEGVKGFGAFGLAQIVAEAGDLAGYAAPAKLWKRMGLAVIAGMAQRRVSGAEALEHGFSPVRRSIMFMIGDSLIKKQNVYRELYLKRKEFEAAKQPDFSKMRIHLRAHRYIEKRLLRDLWRAWRDAVAVKSEAA